jgi:hypothetical protein
MNATAVRHEPVDSHEQLRRLYRSLLEDQNRFDEFKQLLALYPVPQSGDAESPEAEEIRSKLNGRIQDWLSGDFVGLSATQVVLWRGIVVEERINVALSPWREANAY